MSMEGNFNNYRQLLKEISPPMAAVPFLGLFLSDLLFVEDGNPDTIMACVTKDVQTTVGLAGEQTLETQLEDTAEVKYRQDACSSRSI